MKGRQGSTPSTGGNIRRILDILYLNLFSKKIYFDRRVFDFLKFFPYKNKILSYSMVQTPS